MIIMKLKILIVNISPAVCYDPLVPVDVPQAAFLLLLGFASSVISSSVGGGGFLVSSGLVFLGLPPQVAVGTSRFGGIGSTATAIVAFSSKGKIDPRVGAILAVISCIGALAGMFSLQRVPDAAWNALASVNLLLALVVVLSDRTLGVKVVDVVPSRAKKILGYGLYAIVGAWVGFFGGGGAIIANLILLVFFGQSFLESAGTRKIPALFVAVLTFGVSAAQGQVDWVSGFFLLVGMTAGSYCGARVVLALGDAWMRRLVIAFLMLSLAGTAYGVFRSLT